MSPPVRNSQLKSQDPGTNEKSTSTSRIQISAEVISPVQKSSNQLD